MAKSPRTARRPRPGLAIALLVAGLACVLAGCNGLALWRFGAGSAGNAGIPAGGQAPGLVHAGGVVFGAPVDPAGKGDALAHAGGVVFLRVEGTIRAPAGIVSHRSDSLATRTASRQALAVIAELPVPRVPVSLRDAAGHPVRDASGSAIATVSDDAGRYRLDVPIQAPSQARTLVLEARLPDGKGAITAFVTPIATGATAVVDADLASTLAAGYILDQYVIGQADPVAALGRLPPDVTDETRIVTRLALAETSTAVPERLQTADVVDAMANLRRNHAGLNAQLEKVRALIVLGQPDLGAGLAATEVALGAIRQILPLPDGSLYLTSPGERRIWLLRDGMLHTAAGSGVPDAGSVHGRPGPEAGLFSLAGAFLDAHRRLLILEAPFDRDPQYGPGFADRHRSRLTRLGWDGKLVEIWADAPAAVAVVSTPQDDVLVLTTPGRGEPASLWAIGPDGSRERRFAFSQADTAILETTRSFGLAPDGRLHLICRDDAGEALYVLDPGSGRITRTFAGTDAWYMWLDPAAHLFFAWRTDAQGMRVRDPDGATQPLVNIPEAVLGATLSGAGRGWISYRLAGRHLVYELSAGELRPIAGLVSTPTTPGASVSAFALTAPSGIGFSTRGDVLVADLVKRQVFKVAENGTATPVAGRPGPFPRFYFGDGKALEIDLYAPTTIRGGQEDDFFILDTHFAANPIHRVTADGQSRMVYRAGPNLAIKDFVLSAAGSLLVAAVDTEDQRPKILQVDGAGNVSERYVGERHDTTFGTLCLGQSPDRSELYVIDGPRLLVSRPGAAAVMLAQDDRFGSWDWPNAMSTTTIAVDDRHRVYFASPRYNLLFRYDRLAQRIEAVAGQGAPNLAGNTIDDSISGPGFPALDARGNLYFSDQGHRLVRMIPADRL